MAHAALICRECFTETEIKKVSNPTDARVACPNCGNESFGI